MTNESHESIVCLVRHGATAWNAARRLQGQKDVPLTAEGVRQAEQAGRALARRIRELGRARWDALYTSPLQRAARTAEALARWIGVAPVVEHDLVERAFGVLEGLTREEAAEAFPEWWLRPYEIDGLESEELLRARAVRAIERLEARHRGGAIVVVSHGAFIHSFLIAVQAVDPSLPRTPLANGGFTIVARDGAGWRPVAINESGHLFEDPEIGSLSGPGEV